MKKGEGNVSLHRGERERERESVSDISSAGILRYEETWRE